MFRKGFVFFIMFVLAGLGSVAQTDSSFNRLPTRSAPQYRRPVFRDSASLARWQAEKDSIRRVKDSLKAVGDSLSMVWLKRPDPNRPNQFLDSLIEVYSIKDLNFQVWSKRFPKKADRYDKGKPRARGELWIIAFVFILLFCFALLKNAFSKELSAIVQAFYSNRVLGQINKEEKFFNSWPFIFLYLLFGFTIGMFLYQCGKYFQISYNYSGFGWFLRLSLIVIVLFTAKIVILRVLGFLLDAGKIAKEYISILILSYFNAALLFLPIVIAFCLTPARFAPVYIYLSFILIGCIFLFQFLRAATNILTNYRFPIIYLIFYLCALEICPLLILIKALRF
ncbi:DUF4271 domain-containing protein [Paradesertivirga mongoliensis]|uniref:DUF4271 domain-containing protein n=1 Tax=Paradesertivirga mongoliensis TaxID=2100740 RepID=A0ABW4ZHM3_9SPHI|nr:DUF4271 domain-containing protein [Pedobacter mongoliensis]